MSSSMRCLRCKTVAETASRARSIKRSFASTAKQDAVPSRIQEPETIPPAVNYQDMSSLAHAELVTHREIRQMARVAAWEMPLLTALSKPFEPPTDATPLRWRYTTYFGELHPAANKVVVEFGIGDLKHLTEDQKILLRKLAGPRRDPITDMVKMSCESFPTQAQNKRFLGDTIANLIKEAIEGKDKFEDVPIDDRHAMRKAKRRQRAFPVAKFPKEWYLTPERRAYLDAKKAEHWKDRQLVVDSNPALAAPDALQAEEAAKLLKEAGVDAEKVLGPSSEKQPEPVYVHATVLPANKKVLDGMQIISEANLRAASTRSAQSKSSTPTTSRPPPSARGRR